MCLGDEIENTHMTAPANEKIAARAPNENDDEIGTGTGTAIGIDSITQRTQCMIEIKGAGMVIV